MCMCIASVDPSTPSVLVPCYRMLQSARFPPRRKHAPPTLRSLTLLHPPPPFPPPPGLAAGPRHHAAAGGQPRHGPSSEWQGGRAAGRAVGRTGRGVMGRGVMGRGAPGPRGGVRRRLLPSRRGPTPHAYVVLAACFLALSNLATHLALPHLTIPLTLSHPTAPALCGPVQHPAQERDLRG